MGAYVRRVNPGRGRRSRHIVRCVGCRDPAAVQIHRWREQLEPSSSRNSCRGGARSWPIRRIPPPSSPPGSRAKKSMVSGCRASCASRQIQVAPGGVSPQEWIDALLEIAIDPRVPLVSTSSRTTQAHTLSLVRLTAGVPGSGWDWESAGISRTCIRSKSPGTLYVSSQVAGMTSEKRSIVPQTEELPGRTSAWGCPTRGLWRWCSTPPRMECCMPRLRAECSDGYQ